ncbi:MAG: aldehyde dehydrogenase family protein [Actinomycetota bacterium]
MSQPFYLAGKWRSSPASTQLRSPFDDAVVDQYDVPTPQDLKDAVAAAAAAHAAGPPPRHERSKWLARAAEIVVRDSAELARLLVVEGGKPLKAARAEVARLASTLRWSAEEARRLDGELLPLDTAAAYGDRAGLVTRVPAGPVLGITPFNYPLNLAAHKVGPALAAGCPIILKPATATALSGLALGRVLDEAGVAPGYLSVVPVRGSAIEAIVDDSRIAKISFTGSAEVGWELRRRAPRARVTLELGGNAAVVVCADAVLDLAADRITWGAFNQAGQSCISAQRVYAEREIFDSLLEQLVAKTDALVVGDPADEETDVGPLIDASNTARVETWVGEAVAGGARAVTGGKREDPFYLPTILTDVDPAMKVSCEEVFGPVLSVDRFDDFDRVLDSVNSGRFGLQAAVFTGSLDRTFRAFERLQVGGVIVNDVASWRADEMPYGGVKESGSGREGVRYAIQEMTEPRLLVLNGIRW